MAESADKVRKHLWKCDLQGREIPTVDPKVAGSSPVRVAAFLANDTRHDTCRVESNSSNTEF